MYLHPGRVLVHGPRWDVHSESALTNFFRAVDDIVPAPSSETFTKRHGEARPPKIASRKQITHHNSILGKYVQMF